LELDDRVSLIQSVTKALDFFPQPLVLYHNWIPAAPFPAAFFWSEAVELAFFTLAPPRVYVRGIQAFTPKHCSELTRAASISLLENAEFVFGRIFSPLGFLRNLRVLEIPAGRARNFGGDPCTPPRLASLA